MTHSIRGVTDSQCQQLADDLAGLDMELARVLSRHKGLGESVWLGGDQKADNTEDGPKRITKALSLLKLARDLVGETGHEVALYRAIGDDHFVE